MEKEIMLAILNYFIIIQKANRLDREKHDAVRKQEFELAARLRTEQNELFQQVITDNELEELRNKLLNS